MRVNLTRREAWWRVERVGARAVVSGDGPPTVVIVSSCRFQICKNFKFWMCQKTSKLDRMLRFSRKPKNFSPNPYVLSSNPWLALIPTVGYDFYQPRSPWKNTKINLMEKNCKLHTFGIHGCLSSLMRN